MDCSLPGSSIHGIFQARILEWGVIAFSNVSAVIHKKVLLLDERHTFFTVQDSAKLSFSLVLIINV